LGKAAMVNRFCHLELGTADLAKAKKFYKGLFKWKLSSFHEGYTLIDTGDKNSSGGMMQNDPPKPPSAWMPYVAVDDVKKAIAKAKKLGAKVTLEYMEIPDGMGAFGVFTDPTGASIGVWAAARKAKARKK
jgi:predicted enzyme related to lactoylglutathione lyase